MGGNQGARLLICSGCLLLIACVWLSTVQPAAEPAALWQIFHTLDEPPPKVPPADAAARAAQIVAADVAQKQHHALIENSILLPVAIQSVPAGPGSSFSTMGAAPIVAPPNPPPSLPPENPSRLLFSFGGARRRPVRPVTMTRWASPLNAWSGLQTLPAALTPSSSDAPLAGNHPHFDTALLEAV